MHEAATFRSCFKLKAQNTLPHLYGFHGKDKETVQKIIAATLDFQCYRYEFFEGHPEKVRTSKAVYVLLAYLINFQPRKNALRHPAIWAILSVFFESAETKVASMNVMPSFATMPIETIAFALRVVCCTSKSIFSIHFRTNAGFVQDP